MLTRKAAVNWTFALFCLFAIPVSHAIIIQEPGDGPVSHPGLYQFEFTSHSELNGISVIWSDYAWVNISVSDGLQILNCDFTVTGAVGTAHDFVGIYEFYEGETYDLIYFAREPDWALHYPLAVYDDTNINDLGYEEFYPKAPIIGVNFLYQISAWANHSGVLSSSITFQALVVPMAVPSPSTVFLWPLVMPFILKRRNRYSDHSSDG